MPNYGPPGATANNYLADFNIPIKSNQGDVRVDQYVGPKNQFFARFTYKNKRAFQVPSSGFASSPYASAAEGSNAIPEADTALMVAWNSTISATVVNEVRGGFSLSRAASTIGITAQQSANALGLTALPQPTPIGADVVPNIIIAGFVPTFGYSSNGDQGTKQLLDTVTWTKGTHTIKFGADYRRMHAFFNSVFYNLLQGAYNFQWLRHEPVAREWNGHASRIFSARLPR